MNDKHQSKGRGLDQLADQGIFQLRFESRFAMFQKKMYGCCGSSICLANDYWNELSCAWVWVSPLHRLSPEIGSWISGK